MILLTEIPLARNYYLVSVPDIRESHITRRLAESCSVLSLQEEFDISKGTNTLSIFGGVARGSQPTLSAQKSYKWNQVG